MSIITYGIGRDYLPNWTITDALREIYQNFIDYGDYSTIKHTVKIIGDKEYIDVELRNNYNPEDLSFLKIGNSLKANNNAIGKHGEGLKMAMLIFARSSLDITIKTNNYLITPLFKQVLDIGEIFAINKDLIPSVQEFSIRFTCPLDIYNSFIDNILCKKDIILATEYGSIVNKPKGNIYSGGLFVTNINKLTYAYDIHPRHLELDRDRRIPNDWDITYYTSKMNSMYGKFTIKDIGNKDIEYIDKLPSDIVSKITPTIIGKDVVFVHKENNEETIISSVKVKSLLKQDKEVVSLITKLKMFIAKQLGITEMLLEFKRKHVYGSDAIEDFDRILDRVKEVVKD